MFSNEASLRLTHEVSLLQLKNKDRSTYLFYFFMGLMPGGAEPSQLSVMWDDSWEKSKQMLDKFGFLENDNKRKRIVLKPFLITYAEETLDSDSKNKLNAKITKFYSKKIEEFYKKIGVKY